MTTVDRHRTPASETRAPRGSASRESKPVASERLRPHGSVNTCLIDRSFQTVKHLGLRSLAAGSCSAHTFSGMPTSWFCKSEGPRSPVHKMRSKCAYARRDWWSKWDCTYDCVVAKRRRMKQLTSCDCLLMVSRPMGCMATAHRLARASLAEAALRCLQVTCSAGGRVRVRPRAATHATPN